MAWLRQRRTSTESDDGIDQLAALRRNGEPGVRFCELVPVKPAVATAYRWTDRSLHQRVGRADGERHVDPAQRQRDQPVASSVG